MNIKNDGEIIHVMQIINAVFQNLIQSFATQLSTEKRLKTIRWKLICLRGLYKEE